MHLKEWLINFAGYYQISPDNDYTYLPYANQTAVYDLYKSECEFRGDGTHIAKRKYFLAVWSLEPALRYIRIRKYLRFAKCDDCVDFRARRDKTRDRVTREQIKKDDTEDDQEDQSDSDSDSGSSYSPGPHSDSPGPH